MTGEEKAKRKKLIIDRKKQIIDDLDRKHEEYKQTLPKPIIKKDLSWLKDNKEEFFHDFFDSNAVNKEIERNILLLE